MITLKNKKDFICRQKKIGIEFFPSLIMGNVTQGNENTECCTIPFFYMNENPFFNIQLQFLKS
jgi:hypothetical protein